MVLWHKGKEGEPIVRAQGNKLWQRKPLVSCSPNTKPYAAYGLSSINAIFSHQTAQTQTEGYIVVYTGGSAKVVRGWSQAGFGGWHGRGSPKNLLGYLPLGERQSNGRAGLRAVLKALHQKQPAERLLVAMDAEIVYERIAGWMHKWSRHGWVGHSDLWQGIHALVIMHGDTLFFLWVPSRVNIEGNEQADTLAEQGRLQHPHNEFHDPKRRCGLQCRDARLHLGLEEMQSGPHGLVNLTQTRTLPPTQVYPRYLTSRARPLTTPQQ